MPDLPTVQRVSYHDAAHAAAPRRRDDPGYAGSVASEAVRLAPLQAIQTAFDQLASHAADRARGEPWGHSISPGAHTADVLRHAGRLRDVLRTAADAADAMIGRMTDQTNDLERAMKKEKDVKSDAPDPPQLTTDGSPHPLQEGGYDADADPGLPGNISDVEALKEGKTTKAQAAALGEGDARAAADDEADRKAADKKAQAHDRGKGRHGKK